MPPTTSSERPDLRRRALLRGRLTPPITATRPPWARPANFLKRCTRCGACRDACPERIIIVGDGEFPEIDFGRGACTFCAACVEACPEPVFDIGLTPPWTVRAEIGSVCLAARGVYCESCRDPCVDGAVRFTHVAGKVPQPAIFVDRCTGCGACVAACPVAAISIRPDATMEWTVGR